MKKVLEIKGMTCGSCVKRVNKIISGFKGVSGESPWICSGWRPLSNVMHPQVISQVLCRPSTILVVAHGRRNREEILWKRRLA